MKISEVEQLIPHCDMLSRKRNGNFIARWGFFYTNGRSSDKYAASIKAQLGDRVTIVDHGEQWKPFRASDTVKQGSHFYVEFKI